MRKTTGCIETLFIDINKSRFWKAMGYNKAVYQMLFLKARALKDTKSGQALEILHHLKVAQPRDYNVHRMMGEIYFGKNDFNNALWVFYLLYIREKYTKDLQYLVCSCIYSKSFTLFFEDMKIHRDAKETFVKNTIDKLLKRTPHRGYPVIFENRFNSSGQTRICDGPALRQVMEKISSNNLGARKSALLNSLIVRTSTKNQTCTSRLCSSGCTDAFAESGVAHKTDVYKPSTEMTAIQITHDEFNILYTVALQKIKDKKIATGLDLLLVAYNVGSHFELLEFLKGHEKMEVLYFLSRASPIFQKYYDEAMQAIKNAKTQVLHLLMLKKCPVLIEELIETL